MSDLSDLLKAPGERRAVWAVVSHVLWREAWKRPWRGVRWRAWIEASGYSVAADPPRGWPNGTPYEWSDWR